MTSVTVPAAKLTVAAGSGPMSRPSAELIGACMANAPPTAIVSVTARPRSMRPSYRDAGPRGAPARVERRSGLGFARAARRAEGDRRGVQRAQAHLAPGDALLDEGGRSHHHGG